MSDAVNSPANNPMNSSMNTREISAAMPAIIMRGDCETSFSLVRTFTHAAHDWLPEAYALFNTPGLSFMQRWMMQKALFVPLAPLHAEDVHRLADNTAAIGRYGFSFPQWRFITQGMGGPSLIERCGYKKLERVNDVADETLPKSNPARDHFGTGFVRHGVNWTFEYRRAYILCAHHEKGDEAVLVVRNNSYFFGRDKLPYPAYVAWKNIPRAQLEKLNDADFENTGLFTPWHRAFSHGGDIPPVGTRLSRMARLIGRFDDEDMKISAFLRSRDGMAHLAKFARDIAARNAPIFYAAQVDKRLPPWTTRHAVAGDASFAAALEARRPGHPFKDTAMIRLFSTSQPENAKFVLLSGPDGDFPVRPATPTLRA